MQVLPELIRTLNNEFLKTQVLIERKINQSQPIEQDVTECVRWGANFLQAWLEDTSTKHLSSSTASTAEEACKKFRRSVLAVMALNRLKRIAAKSRQDTNRLRHLQAEQNEASGQTQSQIQQHHGVQITSGLHVVSQSNSGELESIQSKGVESHPDGKSPQIENSGRWSDEEHKRFRAALIKFGRKWSKVARYTQTRTDAQARSHAQKYLRKLKKYGCAGNEQEFQILKARGHSRLPKLIKKSGDNSIHESSVSADGSSYGTSGNVSTAKKKRHVKVNNLSMLIEAAKQLSYGPFVLHTHRQQQAEVGQFQAFKPLR